MSTKHYLTSDLYEAAALVVYGFEIEQLVVDQSKTKPEALFKFPADVGDLPHKYRDNNLLVDAQGLKDQVVKLKKKMFPLLDGLRSGASTGRPA